MAIRLKHLFIIIATIITLSSCFSFEAPVDANFDVQECELIRDLNEGEDPWYHCEEYEYDENSELKEEGDLCCLNSECKTTVCICGICTTAEGIL